MGTKVFTVNGRQYIYDSETKKFRRIKVEDEAPMPLEDAQKLLSMFADMEVEKTEK